MSKMLTLEQFTTANKELSAAAKQYTDEEVGKLSKLVNALANTFYVNDEGKTIIKVIKEHHFEEATEFDPAQEYYNAVVDNDNGATLKGVWHAPFGSSTKPTEYVDYNGTFYIPDNDVESAQSYKQTGVGKGYRIANQGTMYYYYGEDGTQTNSSPFYVVGWGRYTVAFTEENQALLDWMNKYHFTKISNLEISADEKFNTSEKIIALSTKYVKDNSVTASNFSEQKRYISAPVYAEIVLNDLAA